MEKGKLYTVIGIDGIQLSRTKGISVLFDGVKGVYDDVRRDAYDHVVNMSVEDFMDYGADALVAATLDQDGRVHIDEVVDFGVANEWDDALQH